MATKKSLSSRNIDAPHSGTAGAEPGSQPVAQPDPGKARESLDEAMGYIPSGVISFKQLETVQAAQDVTEQLMERIGQMNDMLMNIIHADSQAVPDKLKATRTLFEEFVQVSAAALSGNTAKPAENLAEAAVKKPSRIRIIEDSGNTNRRAPVKLLVELIQPGWGNTRDNHYYPAEMLKRDANVFVGAKMYTTDHRIEEKSVRTEVSLIESVIGFSDAGAPVARVLVFDPDFAEKCRNMADSKTLTSLSCSILADGTAKPFELSGRKGKAVDSITTVSSVDWVTRAGAGGRAIALAESEKGRKKPAAAPISQKQVEATIDGINNRYLQRGPLTDSKAKVIEAVNGLFFESKSLPDPNAQAVEAVNGQFFESKSLPAPNGKTVEAVNDRFLEGKPFPNRKNDQVDRINREFLT